MSRLLSSTKDSSVETSVVLQIGRGSFGTVYSLPGYYFVFKVVQQAENAQQLKAEFLALRTLYEKCNSDSLFSTPRGIRYFNPAYYDLISSPAPPAALGRRLLRPRLTADFFAPVRHLDSASYAMDRAACIPITHGDYIRQHYYPPAALQRQPPVARPSLCRLYFGKPAATSRSFVNPINFPIDVERYSQLVEHFSTDIMFPLLDVCEGMGQMLSLIHWVAAFDGRDIEFVMAGDGVGALRYYVIDFNQMRQFSPSGGDIDDLVSSFFDNDPYYPRPNPSTDTYAAFRQGYLTTCPDHYRPRAHEFLQRIEARQSQRGAALLT